MVTKLLDVRVDDYSIDQIIALVKNSIVNNKKMLINYANIHALNLSYSYRWLREYFNQSDVIFCDGFGVILGARILGTELNNRNTPPDWVDFVCQLCITNNFSLVLLGSKSEIVENAATCLSKKHPLLKIQFTHHGYFDKTPGHPENEAVISAINTAKPDILLVGFGMPMQEKWIMENFDRLDVKVFLPVGAAFDYISGNVPRAPRWMTDNGLEWLGRLIIEPRRLWKRYLIGIPLFFWRVLKQRFGILKLPK